TAPVNLSNDVETYTWTVPPGFVIVSGQNTNQITVSVPSSGASAGNVTLVASNPCGSISRSRAVTLAAFNGISVGADFSICSGTTPTLTNTLSGGATRVTWTTPTGTVTGGPHPTSFIFTPPAGFAG